jgi:hypothetical protein
MGASFELSGKVVIKAEHLAEVKCTFRDMCPADAAWLYRVHEGRVLLADCFKVLRVEPEVNEEGDIVYLSYWQDVSDPAEAFWAAIAKVVEDGSYLTVTERDWDVHELYRFEDGKLAVREGELVYHLPQLRQRAADIAEGVRAALQELQSPPVDYGAVGQLLEEARLLALALKQSLEDAEQGVEVEE